MYESNKIFAIFYISLLVIHYTYVSNLSHDGFTPQIGTYVQMDFVLSIGWRPGFVLGARLSQEFTKTSIFALMEVVV